MAYAIIRETEWGYEYRTDIKGTRELEKYTDKRIMAIYGAKAKAIYKVYSNGTCIIMKGEN
jgi:hypothetical protein